MAFFHKKPDWQIPESQATDESVYFSRRQILRAAGYAGLGAIAGSAWSACSQTPNNPETGARQDAGPPTSRPVVRPDTPPDTAKPVTRTMGEKPAQNYPSNAQAIDLYPPTNNDAYKVSERPITPEESAQQYNNFYEFTVDKGSVWKETGKYETTPWTVEFGGLVNKPLKLDLDNIIRQIGIEERVYRFRCVEAWSMTVPWAGFPLAKLLKLADVNSKAKYVRFLSPNLPDQMPGQARQTWYPWPYHEGLRIDEATNDLAFVATGVYGHPLTRQMGAPIRIAMPWKYGYKSPKAIVKIEFTSVQPKTFWNNLIPDEYGFYSNVNPKKPHPRWSQAKEKLLPDFKEIDTQPYNGYAAQVSSLYTGDED